MVKYQRMCGFRYVIMKAKSLFERVYTTLRSVAGKVATFPDPGPHAAKACISL